MKLDEFQKQIVETNESKVVVVSSAAAGKTASLTERITFLLNNGIKPTEIVVTSFSNMAAETVSERLGKIQGITISTLHSYCNRILLEHGIDTSSILKSQSFDKLFELAKAHPEIKVSVKHFIIDEAQDLDENQISFILDFIKPENYMFFLDPKQQIYEFRGSSPKRILELRNQKDVKFFNMPYNYRNDKNILTYAKGFLSRLGYDYQDRSIPKSEECGRVITSKFDEENVINTIKTNDEYRDWMFLTRDNKQLSTIETIFKKHGIPYNTFKQGDISLSELVNLMKENKVLLLTAHSSKGLERPNVMYYGARYGDNSEMRLNYVAASRAKSILVWLSGSLTKKKKPYTPKKHYNITSWD